jgi:hypothetical protein
LTFFKKDPFSTFLIIFRNFNHGTHILTTRLLLKGKKFHKLKFNVRAQIEVMFIKFQKKKNKFDPISLWVRIFILKNAIFLKVY